MWLVLAGVAGAIVTLLTIVLVTPVELELSATKTADNPAVRVKTSVRWNGLRLDHQRADRKPAKTRPKTGGRQASIEWSGLKTVLTAPGFMRRFARFISDELRLTRPRDFHLRARIGFEDPSDTGMFLAWACVVRASHCFGHDRRESPRAVNIQIEPDFAREVCEGELRVRWSRSPASILWPVGTFGVWTLMHVGPRKLWRLTKGGTS